MTAPMSNDIIKYNFCPTSPIIVLNHKFATMPITNDGQIIFTKEIVIFLMPIVPILFLRLINNNTVPNTADILVTKSKAMAASIDGITKRLFH